MYVHIQSYVLICLMFQLQYEFYSYLVYILTKVLLLLFIFLACNDGNCTVDKWLSRLESSGWLTNVKDVLTCACLVAQCLEQDGKMILILVH